MRRKDGSRWVGVAAAVGLLAGVYRMPQVQDSLIERIEIVKGAGLALYGSDAIAWVINVITRAPAAFPSMQVGVSAGANPLDATNRYGNMPLVARVNLSTSHPKGDFAARAERSMQHAACGRVMA